MNPADAFRLENEAGELLTMGADPRRVLAVLAPFPAHPRTRAQSLRASAWLTIARREGPTEAAEACLRAAFEGALADHRNNPSIYAPDLFEGTSSGNDMIRLGIGSPFLAWFEYLVTFGRFAEAQAARDRVMPLLGPSFFVKPRPHIRALVEALASCAKPDIFQRAFEPDFLPPLAALAHAAPGDLRVSLLDGPGFLEVVAVALPVPLFTGEPLWLAFARVPGTERVRIFTLDWFGEEWLARPAAWSSRAYLGAREYGPSIAPGAAPRPTLGPASPYVPPFLHFIGVELRDAAPSPAPAPRSLPPSRSLPPPRRSDAGGRTALALVAALLVGFVAAFGGLWLRAAHH